VTEIAVLANILTIDVEDWGQSAPDVYYPARASTREMVPPTERVVANTVRLLGIIGDLGVRTTCFVLGSVAERFPGLVREIAAAGHEVASHGYGHRPVYAMTPEEFTRDVRRSLDALEDALGRPVRGFRAPYFSITRESRWALPILAEQGLEFDASLFPCHPAYYRFPGWSGWPQAERYPHVLDVGGRLLHEVPTTTVSVLGQHLPFAGGAYLRFLPMALFRQAVREANGHGYPAVFYLHPHDLDAEELRRPVPGEDLRIRLLRWFLNAGRTRNANRLRQLVRGYTFTTVGEWLAARPAPAEAMALRVQA
jgi:polysaccharide deacetylase family protein (PEP-CTERM system associated)